MPYRICRIFPDNPAFLAECWISGRINLYYLPYPALPAIRPSPSNDNILDNAGFKRNLSFVHFHYELSLEICLNILLFLLNCLLLEDDIISASYQFKLKRFIANFKLFFLLYDNHVSRRSKWNTNTYIFISIYINFWDRYDSIKYFLEFWYGVELFHWWHDLRLELDAQRGFQQQHRHQVKTRVGSDLVFLAGCRISNRIIRHTLTDIAGFPAFSCRITEYPAG